MTVIRMSVATVTTSLAAKLSLCAVVVYNHRLGWCKCCYNHSIKLAPGHHQAVLGSVLQVPSNGARNSILPASSSTYSGTLLLGNWQNFVFLFYSFSVRHCISCHTPFFSRTINIIKDQTFILDIIGRRNMTNKPSMVSKWMDVCYVLGFASTLGFLRIEFIFSQCLLQIYKSLLDETIL